MPHHLLHPIGLSRHLFTASAGLFLAASLSLGCSGDGQDTDASGGGAAYNLGGADGSAAGGGSASGGSGAGSGAANGSGGGGPQSEFLDVTVTPVPANRTVGLDWPTVDGADSYNVYIGESADVTITSGTKIENAERGYIHRRADNGTTYFYIITALIDGVESAPTRAVSATPGGEWMLEELGTGDYHAIKSDGRVPTIALKDRFHITLFAEGYTSADLGKFHDQATHDTRSNDVDDWIDEVFEVEPYSLLPEAFIVWILPEESPTTIRATPSDTAFQVPVDVSGSFGQTGSISSSGETATRAWAALEGHPFAPAAADGTVRNFVTSFLIFDPDRGSASVSGRALTLRNPNQTNQRVNAAFGVGHAHEFTHAFSNLRDEYMENDNNAPASWDDSSNVVGSNVCSELPWEHLLVGGAINPDVDELVGAFGHADRGYHSELLCMMNGTHENNEYFGDDSGGACSLQSCTLRSEGRLCNFCREMSAYRILRRTGVLADDASGLAEWQSDYRAAFYSLYEFQVPGEHFPGKVPQSNDRNNQSNGTEIFHACIP